jgi:cell division protein FtsA
VKSFNEEQPVKISRQDLAHIIEARVDEMFALTLQEIKRSGYDGLLPAGMVLTGGTSALPGIRQLASQVLGLPVRTAQPENLVGLVDQLKSPAYSTGIGLLHWAAAMTDNDLTPARGPKHPGGITSKPLNLGSVKDFFKRLLPSE